MAQLQETAKLGTLTPSDEIAGLAFKVTWEPAAFAFAVHIHPEDAVLPEGALTIVGVDSSCSLSLVDLCH